MSLVISRCHKVALVVPTDGRYEIQTGFLLLQGDIYLLANFGLYIPDVCRLLQSHRNFVGLSPVKNVGVCIWTKSIFIAITRGLHLLVNIILQYDFLNDFYTKNYTYSYLQKSFLIFGISRIFLGDDATLLLVFLEHDLGSSKNGVVGPNSIGE